MAIPFQTLEPLPLENVAGIAIPKRGCLTVAEEMAVRGLQEQVDKEAEGMTELQKDLVLKQHVITLLIQSRLDKSWTLEKTKAPMWEVEIDGSAQEIEPDMIMLDALFEFFMNEQRRWRKAETEGETNGAGKKKLTGAKSTGS